MANINIKVRRLQFGGPSPYGNATAFRFPLRADSSGAPLLSDSAAALAVGDKVYLGGLPEGFVIHDAQLVVSTAFTASNTADVGFEYADGVDDASYPQNLAGFFSGQSTATTTRARSSVVLEPKPLPKEAKVVFTQKGAALAKAAAAYLLVIGELIGPR
jgi:hypothetical protein